VTVNVDLNSRLLEVISGIAGLPALAFASPPEAMSGGFWAELLAFSLAEPPPGWPRDLVARLMPDAALARKETIIQAAVAAAGFRTPAIRASGGPGAGLGRAFMIMDRAQGAPLLAGLSGTAAIAAAPRLAGRLPGTLAAAMAALHKLDAGLVRADLVQAGVFPMTLPGLLGGLTDMAASCGRADLADAGRWLAGHQPPEAPEVICHGDLHPFNLLDDRGQVTVLDWTASLLAPRAYDVAFTTLMLAEPPLSLPGPARQLARQAGRQLAGQFTRRYRALAGTVIGAAELSWHQAVVCLRALTEVAGWVHQGQAGEHASHPWLTSSAAMAARLMTLTGVTVRNPPVTPPRAAPGSLPR
jgi:aminoglycoside phosphotransferase (APT) family kinase protein